MRKYLICKFTFFDSLGRNLWKRGESAYDLFVFFVGDPNEMFNLALITFYNPLDFSVKCNQFPLEF